MKENIFSVTFWKSAMERAIYTFAEVLMGFLILGEGIGDIEWSTALSVSLLATLLSIIKSVVFGTPESEKGDE